MQGHAYGGTPFVGVEGPISCGADVVDILPDRLATLAFALKGRRLANEPSRSQR